jgi:hypothetical protein
MVVVTRQDETLELSRKHVTGDQLMIFADFPNARLTYKIIYVITGGYRQPAEGTISQEEPRMVKKLRSLGRLSSKCNVMKSFRRSIAIHEFRRYFTVRE